MALSPFRMVASIYKPLSVKAFGSVLVFDNFVVENFYRKSSNSDFVNSIIQLSGNLSGLFFTALFISRVSTP